jgi:hypothetical protein
VTRKKRETSYPITPDGRYFVVKGRLWRLSNSHLSLATRKALTAQLMTARRAVRDAVGKPELLAQARRRVDHAKRSLGERGPVWWNDQAPDYNRRAVKNTPYALWYSHLAPRCPAPPEDRQQLDALIERTIFALLRKRSATASSCPSEVARALVPDDERRWRRLMPDIRRVLAPLVQSERLRVTRGSLTLRAEEFSGGPIRIRRGKLFG